LCPCQHPRKHLFNTGLTLYACVSLAHENKVFISDVRILKVSFSEVPHKDRSTCSPNSYSM